MHLFSPPPWGKQDKGMRTDGLREGAAPSLLCVSGGSWARASLSAGRKDCWQVCLLPKAPPPARWFLFTSFQVCSLHFSLPGNTLLAPQSC